MESINSRSIHDQRGESRKVQLGSFRESNTMGTSQTESSESPEILQDLGYKSELKREFNFFSVFSFAISISGLFATLGTSFIYPLSAGGAACIVWAWALAGVGCICIALSVAEIVSAVPTSGGLYVACSRIFPPKKARFMCWLVGWMNLLGQVACVSSTEYGSAQMLLSAVSMGTDFHYVPTAAHTVGVTAAILAFHGAINCLPTRMTERLSKSYIFIHYASLLAGAIALLIKTKPKHEASYVFSHVEANSGWTPVGWSFMFGFMSVSWTMTDYDAPAHLAEEMVAPELNAPRAIAASAIFTYILGFLYNIVLAFCLGDPQELMTELLPVSAIYYNSLGKSGGIAFTVLMFVVMNCVGISVLQSLTRTMWSNARDEMYPYVSQYIKKVNKVSTTPVIAVILSTVICIAVNLIALGSSQTISAIFNVTAIAIDWSCCIPVAGRLLYPNLLQKGPWSLGRFSPYVNAWACLWTLYASIVFFMPTTMPVTKENMNYAVVFFVFIIVAAISCWFVGGSRLYKGPMILPTLDVEVLESPAVDTRDIEIPIKKEYSNHI